MPRQTRRPPILAAGLAAALACAPAASAQEVTLTRVLGEGDTLPNGWPYGGAGLAAIDGDRIAFYASTSEGRAIVVYDIGTAATRIVADTDTTVSPTNGELFKSLGNPDLTGNDLVFPGAALLFTGEWEGLYHTRADGTAGVSVVVDEFFPGVRIPKLPVSGDAGVAYRDAGYAGEPIFLTTLGGAITPVARRGDPAPGGGTYFDLEPPAIAGGTVAFSTVITGPTFTHWAAVAWDAATQEAMLLAKEGDPIPGRGAPFDIVTAHDTDGSQVLIRGRDDAFPSSYQAIYAWRDGRLELLVDTQTVIPDARGATFDSLQAVAIDGDVALFTGFDVLSDHGGVYAVVDGQVIKVLSINDVLEGAPIHNVNVTSRALSGNRAVLNVGLDARGGDAVYLAEIRMPTCRADLDGDGQLTIFDFLAFQNLFDAGDPAADFDGDGDLTIFDFLAFQNEFDAGCP